MFSCKIMPFSATWMDLKIVILSEANEIEKDKYQMISLICGILKKVVQMNLCTRQKYTYRYRNFYDYQRGEGGRVKLGILD